MLPRRRWPVAALVALPALVALVAASALAWRRPPSLAPSAGPTLVGALIRVASGGPDFARLAQQARTAGLDFLVLAGGHPSPAPSRQEGDVTFLSFAELDTPWGQIIAVGRHAAGAAWDGQGPEMVARLAAAGGLGAVAHPFDPLRPWQGAEAALGNGPVGIEIANLATSARRRAGERVPWRLGLATALAVVRPERAAWQLLERDDRALAMWDRMPAGAVALCGSDAAGWLPAAAALGAWRLVVQGTPPPGAKRPDWLTGALVAGNFLCAASAAGRQPAVSLRAYPDAAGSSPTRAATWQPQALVLTLPAARGGRACGTILRDGATAAAGCGDDVVLYQPPPGRYRGEVTAEFGGLVGRRRQAPLVYTQRVDLGL